MEKATTKPLKWSEFQRVEMRIGTVLTAAVFKEARNPSYKLTIDFGAYGTRKTSAQITKLYTTDELIGKQVIAVVNFPPKQIANMMSECLVLAGLGDDNATTLLQPERPMKNGTIIS